MENSYSANFQVCATCDYWMGSRTTNLARTNALVASGSTGDCHETSMRRPSRTNNSKCEKWRLWGGIRKI